MHFKSVHVRQLQIADCEMMSALIEEFDGSRSGGCGINRITFFDEVLPQRVGHHWLVVYYKNPHLFVLHLFLLSGSRCALRAHQIAPSKEPSSVGDYAESGSCTTNRSSASFADPPWASIIFAANASSDLFTADKRMKRIVVDFAQTGPLDDRVMVINRGYFY